MTFTTACLYAATDNCPRPVTVDIYGLIKSGYIFEEIVHHQAYTHKGVSYHQYLLHDPTQQGRCNMHFPWMQSDVYVVTCLNVRCHLVWIEFDAIYGEHFEKFMYGYSLFKESVHKTDIQGALRAWSICEAFRPCIV